MTNKEKKINWEEEFKRDYPVEKFQEVSHYWWKDCYNQIEKFIFKNIPLNNNSEILECGCGSGNSSLKLARLVKKVILLDNSNTALDCAKRLAGYYQVENVEFVRGDVFSMPFNSDQFDFCWNIGLIEHYNFSEAKQIIKEMSRIVKQEGWICLGVPNFMSLPIIKAKFLYFKPLRLFTFRVKGYRLKDETRYDLKDLRKLLFSVSRESGIKFEQVSSYYIGSVLPVETPRFIFEKINKFLSKLFSRLSFLILISAKVKK